MHLSAGCSVALLCAVSVVGRPLRQRFLSYGIPHNVTERRGAIVGRHGDGCPGVVLRSDTSSHTWQRQLIVRCLVAMS